MDNVQIKIPGANDYFTQEAYKTLRTNLQFCGQDYRVIVLTSCEANDGKTTVTLGLAKSLADQGKKVLVLDADMRKSTMAGRNTDAKHPEGLSGMLTGMNSLGECISTTNFPGMDIMFAGNYPPNPVELLSSKNFGTLIGTVKAHYDYVLVDTPPLGAVIDAAVVATVCDGAILVLADEKVRYSQVKEVISQLKKSGSKLLGVVRNQTQKPGKAYRHSKYNYG